jgi:probable HAF family extracellular repeat protein
MSRFRISRIAALAALALATGVPAAAVAAPASAATTYTITDLGSLGGGTSYGSAMNASGQVTGYSLISALVQTSGCCGNCYSKPPTPCFRHPEHAFLHSNGIMTDLGTLGGTDSWAIAINRSGEVVGQADTATGEDNFAAPYGYSQPTGKKTPPLKMIDLDTTVLAGWIGAAVRSLNDSGQMVGKWGYTSGNHGFLISNGTVSDLPRPSWATVCGAAGRSAMVISNNGLILGGCGNATGGGAYLLWQNGTFTDIGALSLGNGAGTATAMNNLGQITGYAMTSSYDHHGFLFSNGTMTVLGNNFYPVAINDNGVIVGGPLIYSGGTLQNLNTLIPAGTPYQNLGATAVNNNGQIVANAWDTATNTTHTLLLTPG